MGPQCVSRETHRPTVSRETGRPLGAGGAEAQARPREPQVIQDSSTGGSTNKNAPDRPHMPEGTVGSVSRETEKRGYPRAPFVTLGLAARPGRFPSDSGKTRPAARAAGLLPSLRSKLPYAPALALRRKTRPRTGL